MDEVQFLDILNQWWPLLIFILDYVVSKTDLVQENSLLGMIIHSILRVKIGAEKQ